MIIDVECPVCRGEGTILAADFLGEPCDINCPRCDVTGCVAYDLNEDCDDDDEY